MSNMTPTSNPVTTSVMKEYMDNYSQNSANRITKQNASFTSLFLLLIVSLVAAASIYLGFQNPPIMNAISTIGCFGVIGMGMFTAFNKNARKGSPIAAIVFSIFEGMMVGGITFVTGNMTFSSGSGWELVGQAILASVCLFFVALVCYSQGIIKATPGFMKALAMGCGAFALLYIVNFLITLITGTNLLYANGPIPIIIAVVAIIFATLSIIGELKVLDDAVERGAEERFKWSIATGFMTSIVWMYIEVLRLLTLLNRD